MKRVIHDGEAAIMIKDEEMHVKIMKDDVSKLSMIHDSHVHWQFWGDVSGFTYVNGMVYNNHSGFVLTPKD